MKEMFRASQHGPIGRPNCFKGRLLRRLTLSCVQPQPSATKLTSRYSYCTRIENQSQIVVLCSVCNCNAYAYGASKASSILEYTVLGTCISIHRNRINHSSSNHDHPCHCDGIISNCANSISNLLSTSRDHDDTATFSQGADILLGLYSFSYSYDYTHGQHRTKVSAWLAYL